MLPGDDLRRVDWRASARSRHPQVRRYRDERAGEWLICLDGSASMGAAPGVWRAALQVAAALAYLILRFDHRVGLVQFSDRVDRLRPPGRGRTTFVGLLHLLIEARPRAGGGASAPECCAPLVDRGRQTVLVTDALRPDAMRGALDRIAARGGGIELIHLTAPPPELSPGNQQIEDIESGARRTIAGGPGAGALADHQARELRSVLRHHCRERGIRYTHAPVGPPPDARLDWERVLLSHLGGSGGRGD